jgi:hypothetical protein
MGKIIMSASAWSYYVPYQSEIDHALENLRQTVFQSGEFYKAPNHWRNMSKQDVISEYRGMPRALVIEALENWHYMAHLPKPNSIEDWLIWNTGEGTHSILDIHGVAEEPDYGVAAPLPDEAILVLFGTHYPTKRDIERQALTLAMLRPAEQATYIIVYQHRLPHQIYFVGRSGN